MNIILKLSNCDKTPVKVANLPLGTRIQCGEFNDLSLAKRKPDLPSVAALNGRIFKTSNSFGTCVANLQIRMLVWRKEIVGEFRV